MNDVAILGDTNKPGPRRLLHSAWQEAYCGHRLLLLDMRRGSLVGWVARAGESVRCLTTEMQAGILVRGL